MTKESLNKYLQELADVLPSVLDDKTAIVDGEGKRVTVNDPILKLKYITWELMVIREYLEAEERIITKSVKVAPIPTKKQ